MAWMRMMGRESVDYHRKTVAERGDDYPGRAMAYYASRGETPLVWGGSGAGGLGLSGSVTAEEYEAIYGPGGAHHPQSSERLASTTRPGMELVVSAHKSVAELGVIGRAEDMHLIMDAEREATLAYLDRVTRRMGGRRGQAAVATPTSGMIYAHTRHATSRAGDPCPHDHVLIANLVEMGDERGGWKAADTTLWREHLHAATMVGRVAAAWAAVDLGYAIEPDPGPSGKLGHWRIAGIPDEVIEMHSKRAAEIQAECERRGEMSYQARGVAARTTRAAKDDHVEADLVARWRGELADMGWPAERLAGAVAAAWLDQGPPARLSRNQAREMLSEILGQDGDLARRKVFCRRDVIVALAPHLYGQDPRFLDGLVDRLLADPEVIPLAGVAGAREQPHSLAAVIATETAIAESLSRQIGRTDAPAVPARVVTQSIKDVEAGAGFPLSAEQSGAAMSICTSRRGGEIVVGVAGAGKTTMLRVVAGAFERSGYRVIGTATSGQAAQSLGREAELGECRTVASLIYRLDRDHLRFDERCVVLVDEIGMTDDLDLVRLAGYVETAGAKLVLIGDHRQLGAVGPGGALQALVSRHPDGVHYLMENRRQQDPGEGQALGELRDGDIDRAVSWYETHDRIHAGETRDQALQAAVDAWAADVTAERDAALHAWRRANVAELNARARQWMQDTGRLAGPELVCPGGLAYRAGERVLALAPGPGGSLVTSQRATVHCVNPTDGVLMLRTDDQRSVVLKAEQADADRLGYGYATTVHRSQGATIGRAHLFADGGGRELAYVAMSRAREETHVWTVADSAAQAGEDLRRDWAIRRSPTWAIDTGQPTPHDQSADSARAIEGQVRQLALVSAEAKLLTHARRHLHFPVLHEALDDACRELERARRDRADLDTGRGAYRDSDAGRAVRDLEAARRRFEQAHWREECSHGWRERRAAHKQVALALTGHLEARTRYDTLVPPEATRLDRQIHRLETTVTQLSARAESEYKAFRASIEVISDDKAQANRLTRAIDTYRDHLDGIQAPAPRPAAQVNHHLHIPPPVPQASPNPPQIGIGM